MAGKQAKVLFNHHVQALLAYATASRYPVRNRVIVLLSVKAGLRAGEIANLTWPMVLDPTGEIATAIELHDGAAKMGSGRRRAIRTARPATGPVVARTSSSTLPRPSMPAGLIQGFPRCFPGSFSTRFGGTAPNRVSTFATAIRSMTAAGARTCGVGCTAAVIGLCCTPRRKQLKNSRFEQHLTSTIGCV